MWSVVFWGGRLDRWTVSWIILTCIFANVSFFDSCEIVLIEVANCDIWKRHSALRRFKSHRHCPFIWTRKINEKTLNLQSDIEQRKTDHRKPKKFSYGRSCLVQIRNSMPSRRRTPLANDAALFRRHFQNDSRLTISILFRA